MLCPGQRQGTRKSNWFDTRGRPIAKSRIKGESAAERRRPQELSVEASPSPKNPGVGSFYSREREMERGTTRRKQSESRSWSKAEHHSESWVGISVVCLLQSIPAHPPATQLATLWIFFLAMWRSRELCEYWGLFLHSVSLTGLDHSKLGQWETG